MTEKTTGRGMVYLLAVVAVLWVWFATDSGIVMPVDEEAILAARIFSDTVERIRTERTLLGIPIDPETDIHETGLIGERYTPLTSTLGSLPAKRSGSTPDAAALLVQLIRRAIDVETAREGDMIVAINCSGSFPGFCVAALAACSALDLDVVTTLSIGASSWGANRPDFTLPDIVAAASEPAGSGRTTTPREPNGPSGDADRNPGSIDGADSDADATDAGNFAAPGSILVTPGGADDRGTDLDPGALEEALHRAEEKGFEVYVPENLADAITRREERYNAAGEVALFVSIGGNAVGTGADADVAMWYGVLTPEDPERETVLADGDRDGLVLRYLRKGVSVVQILNVEQLFSDRGVVFDPAQPPAIGDGRLYRQRPGLVHRIALVVPGIVIVILLGIALRCYNGENRRRRV
ncbi:MAG: poly-gamma-glutamate system protein [Alkalispirochaeta sp.]